jgi:hypothetical protein
MLYKLLLPILFIVCFAPICLVSQNDSLQIVGSNYTYTMTKISSPIVIDGIKDSIWNSIPTLQHFYQSFPFDSSFAVKQTSVSLAYSDNELYGIIYCNESSEGEFVIQSLRRDFDNMRSDNVGILLDPMGTQTNGFMFASNPYGVQYEGFIAQGGAFGAAANWDNVWYCEAALSDSMWIVEFKIPFNSLRFEKSNRPWKFNIIRQNLRVNETSSFKPIPRTFRLTNLAFSGSLVFPDPPKPGMNLSIIPYAIATQTFDYTQNGESKTSPSVGIDIKYGITPSLNLDVTINPDFSQVNVDQQVTNLDRFSIFFPEQRQFFLENSDLFASFGFSRIRPFFSRQIGLYQPTLNARPFQTAIPFGARVTGNIDDEWRVGAMSVQTSQNSDIDYSAQNYSVFAVQKLLFERSNIGAIFVNRQGSNYRSDSLNNFNRIVGLDYNLASADGHWMGKLFYHQMFSPDNKADQFATAGWLQYASPNVTVNWNHEYIGENYNPEVGFVPRNNVFRLEPSVEFAFFPNSDLINNHKLLIYNNTYTSKDFGQLLDRTVELSYLANFQNSAQFSFWTNHTFTRLYFPFDPTGLNVSPLPIGEYDYATVGTMVNTNFREPFSVSLLSTYGEYFNGTRLLYNGSATFRFQPNGSISAFIEQNHINLPDPYESALLTLMRLSVEYSPSKEVFVNAFTQYVSQTDFMNLNVRVQWRFAPMSDVFFVYTDTFRAKNVSIITRGIALRLNYWFNV